MESHNISFEEFVLPFMQDPYADIDEEVDPPHRLEILEQMEGAVPANATHLGTLRQTLDHSPGLSWRIEDHYYLVPLTGQDHQWGIVRISWDDNWSRYTWTGDARGSGFDGPGDAARALVNALVARWQIDLGEGYNKAYRDFLERLKEH